MQEFLEKAKAFSEWHWQGSPWQYLLYVGILLVLLFSKRKMVRLVLGWLPLVYLICIYNPLFMAGMEFMGVGDGQYFARMFSFMPMMYAIAAGIVFLVGRISKSWLKFFVVVAVCAGLIVSGRSIYDQSWFVQAQNYAKVPDDTYEVAAILKNTEEKDASVATYDPITNYMRQVSDVVTSYARDPGQIWHMLDADPPDVQAVMMTAGEQGMDYVTARRTDTTIQAFRDAGYEPFALTDNMAIYKVTGVRKIKRTFNDKRQIVSVTTCDMNENAENNYQGYSTIEYGYDEKGYQNRISYLDAEGRLVMIVGAYAGVRREYSARGLILSSIYVDTEGQPILIAGRYETRYEYDLKGRVTREKYYDADGNLMNRTDEYYASREIHYNKEGLIAEEKFYDVKGDLKLSSSGYARVCRTYDKKRQLISECYYDEQGALTIMGGGFAELHRSYDENGNLLSESFYDLKGNPALLPSGYAMLIRQYDEVGNIVLERYEDGMGKPVMRDKGYAEIRRTFNEHNWNVDETYWNAEGLPATFEGYHEIRRSYNDIGDVIKEQTLDAEGNPVSRGGYAIVQRSYNSQHQILTEAFYDVDGNLVNNSSGYATLERTYDGWSVKEEIVKDAEGNVL